MHVASAELRSFFHAQKSQGAKSVRQAGFTEAYPVVFHNQEDVLVFLD
jgi:hypothetical protein